MADEQEVTPKTDETTTESKPTITIAEKPSTESETTKKATITIAERPETDESS